jgi:raffinose/stachyose/melibiose transport system substrate-binding protein
MFPPARRTRLLTVAAIASLISLTTACAGGGGATPAATTSGRGGSTAAAPSGDITVLTWRTDLVTDGTFDKYKAAFEAKYPAVKVSFEGITDYEGEVKTRMNTTDYGDVPAIVNTITPAQMPDFFEPLGGATEMQRTYRFLTPKFFEGKVYGIPVVGNTQGIVYNKKVWAAAGITAVPTTPEEFLKDLKAIKDKDPSVVPLYTNDKDGWPLVRSGGGTAAPV